MSLSCTGTVADESLERRLTDLKPGSLRMVYNVAVCSQNADSGGEGTRAEGREVAQSGQKHCVGYGGAQQLQVIPIAVRARRPQPSPHHLFCTSGNEPQRWRTSWRRPSSLTRRRHRRMRRKLTITGSVETSVAGLRCATAADITGKK